MEKREFESSQLSQHLHDEYWDQSERRKDTITRTELLAFIARNEDAHRSNREKLEELEEEIKEVRTNLTYLTRETSELIEVFKTLQALSRFIMWFGKIAKPLMMFAAFVTAVTIAVKSGDFSMFK